MTKIGFIGLGNMGFHMCINLAKAGYNIKAYDIDYSNYNKLLKKNVQCLKIINEVLNDNEIIITMLPDGNIVKKVWEQALPKINNKPLLIDCSTIDVKTSKEFHSLANKYAMESLDSPVSGGVTGAKNGNLTFMVGGNEESYNKAKPLFEVMGSKSVLCGSASSGQAVKICNNMLLAITMVGTSEAFNLAENLKIDKQKLFDVISTSSGSCWAVNNYCPIKGIGPISPADNDFKAGFSSKLMHKDLSLAIDSGNRTNTNIKFAHETFKIFSKILENGYGEKDFSFVKEYLK